MKQDNLMQDLLTHPVYRDYPGNIWYDESEHTHQIMKDSPNVDRNFEYKVTEKHHHNDYMSQQNQPIDTTGLAILVIAAAVIALIVFSINTNDKRMRK